MSKGRTLWTRDDDVREPRTAKEEYFGVEPRPILQIWSTLCFDTELWYTFLYVDPLPDMIRILVYCYVGSIYNALSGWSHMTDDSCNCNVINMQDDALSRSTVKSNERILRLCRTSLLVHVWVTRCRPRTQVKVNRRNVRFFNHPRLHYCWSTVNSRGEIMNISISSPITSKLLESDQ